MKAAIKDGLRKVIALTVSLMGRNRVGRYLYSQIITSAMTRTRTASYRGVTLMFAVPNAQNTWRVETFATKEPETLEWIDALPKGAALWDIGANVGLYTCYAAKARDCRVVAFEPSVFNLELLARNVYLNDLVHQVTIVPLALSDQIAVSRLNMTTTEWGGALSTFGREYGHDGRSLHKIFEYQMLGVSIVDAVERLGIPAPDFIKLDVDGIEHLILRGGESILRRVQGILIEINDDFAEQAEGCAAYLRRAGLSLVEKRHSQLVEESAFRGAFNQIWARVLPASPATPA